MTMDLTDKLSTALKEKKLNRKAHDEIAKWLREDEFAEYRDELAKRVLNEEWDRLMDAFYRTVIFGTGGIRGVMDIGTNRINNYTVRWASEAYARYLKKHKAPLVGNGIAIAYDSRLHSEEFMKETARVLAANGIPVRIFKYFRATPELSFTVRHLALAGGIVITASHNPPEYNGYKVYNENGIQVLPAVGLQIEAEFQAVDRIHKLSFEDALAAGTITYIGDEVDTAFAESARKVSLFPGRDVSIVFSPLHGVGSESVLPVLKAVGFENIAVVESQMSLDGAFPEVEGHFPNPEFPVVYDQSIALATKTKADIVIVSDPDADRLGIAVPDREGAWHVLSGNQAAVLMGYFYMNALKDAGKLPAHPVIIKTSVTTDLLRDVAESFGVEVIGDLLVGYKFIGERQEHLPKEKQFIFSCEESVGYSFSDDYRDKGAETPAIVAAEMVTWCKSKGMTALDLLESLYQKHGYYAERLYYRLIEGFGAFDQMNLAMNELRKNLPKEIGGRKVLKAMDRMTGVVTDGATGTPIETRDWDRGDMLSFFFSDDERSALHVRPSGNEPKMKYYTMIKDSLGDRTKEDIDAEARQIEEAAASLFDEMLGKITVDVF